MTRQVSQSFDYASSDHIYSSTYDSSVPYPSSASVDLPLEQAGLSNPAQYQFNAPPPLRAGERSHSTTGTTLTPTQVAPHARIGPVRPTESSAIDRMAWEPGPWAPRSDTTNTAHGLRFTTPGQPVVRPPPSRFVGFRGQALSNPESSHVTDGHGPGNGGGGGGGHLNGSGHHDSGYVTHVPEPKSVQSGTMDYVDTALDDGNSFANGFENINLQPPGAASMGPPPYPMAQPHSAPMSGYAKTHSEHDELLDDLVCPRTECGNMHFKNQSEYT